MTLLRALDAELLKLKRTLALKMVVIAPAVVVLLVFFMVSQAPFSTVARYGIKNQWEALERSNLRFWGFLMMPLYIALQTALLAGLDHNDNQWKSLCARPVPRWTLYVAKLMVTVAMSAASAVLLALGIVSAGVILPKIQPQVVFGPPIPWGSTFRDSLLMMSLAFLALVIQHWVSLRWRSFPVAMGTGIMATIAGIFANAAGQTVGGWPQFFPWALPMLVQARQPPNLLATALIGGAAGVLVVAAGCLEFSRREIQ